MAIATHTRRHRSFIATMALLASAWAMATPGTGLADSPDETFLDGLRGTWDMSGTVGGQPVRYAAEGQRVLQGAFIRLHMVDATSPPRYEADVYIGFDPKERDYIAHWLDRFGAAGSRVVARGQRTGQQLVLVFPYAEGAFRDTFSWQPATGSWTLLLESRSADGTWATFASYALAHRVGP